MCFLIQIEYITLAVGSVEFKSFCYGLFPSVPKRTLRSLTTGSPPRRKTTDALVSDILRLAPDLGEEVVRSALQQKLSFRLRMHSSMRLLPKLREMLVGWTSSKGQDSRLK